MEGRVSILPSIGVKLGRFYKLAFDVNICSHLPNPKKYSPISAMWRTLQKSLRCLWRILFPERCIQCGARLTVREEELCATCIFSLPLTRIHAEPGNGVERLFWAKIDIERASAFMYYIPNSETRLSFMRLKYQRHRPQMGHFFGRMMACDLADTDFFSTIDLIVPVPLSAQRRRQRGYNQAAQLALGIAAATGLPVCEEAVERHVDNPTQTHLNAHERSQNVKDIFRLVRPELVAGRHILLVDDILTTGSTILSCAETLAEAGGVRFSILTMGLSRHYHVPKAVRDLAKNSSEEWQPLEEQVWEYDASTDSRVHPLEENRGEASSDERHS